MSGAGNPLSDLLNSAATGQGQSAGSQAQFNLLLQLLQTIASAVSANTGLVASQQIFTTGSGATYTTPAGCRQLRIQIQAGGGGGGGSGTSGYGNGGDGTTTTFNSIVANGGAHGGGGGQQGSGGTGGTGVANLRISGGSGGEGVGVSTGSVFEPAGGPGGASFLGPTNYWGNIPQPSRGGGGPGADAVGTGSGQAAGGGGGGGEWALIIINNPGASYTYTVGTGGAAGSAGVSGNPGKAGAAGLIIVDEYF